MKTIGILGGMSYKSTIEYYRIINELVTNKLGGFHSAKVLINSVEFNEIRECQLSDDWKKSGEILKNAAQNLEKAGADCVFMSTNTMHINADDIQSGINIPFIHIVDTAAETVVNKGLKKAGVLGSKYVFTSGMFKNIFAKYGIEMIPPNDKDIEMVDHVIFEELCKADIRPESKKEFLRVCQEMQEKGAECIILGCTEIMLLIHPEDVDIPVFDTTYMHCKKAVELALN